MSEPMMLSNSVLKSVMTDAMVYRRALHAGEDMDTVTAPGIYHFETTDLVNAPKNLSKGILRVSNGLSERYVLQEIFMTNGTLTTRLYWWSTWGSWRKIVNEIVS
ncbi:MAG: pyocin knob domain-containing protein [Muribaculaceae bacterium]|nr:pyocin knob domain-containing protein [Muribaculaceae bacterium]